MPVRQADGTRLGPLLLDGAQLGDRMVALADHDPLAGRDGVEILGQLGLGLVNIDHNHSHDYDYDRD